MQSHRQHDQPRGNGTAGNLLAPRGTVVQILNFHPHGQRSMEMFLISLAERLRAEGWRTVHVVCGEPGDYFREESRRLHSPYITTRLPPNYLDAIRLSSQLRVYQPALINTIFLSKFSLPLLLLRRLSRSKHLIASDETSGSASLKGSIKRSLAKIRGRLVAHEFDLVIAVSDFVKQRNIGQSFLPSHKIRTVHNGVEMARFEAVRRTRYETFTVAFVGQLIPEKGVACLIEACRQIAATGERRLQLLIAGHGWQREALENRCRADRLDYVHFLGQIDSVPQLMASADVVVVPSEWEEACGFTVLEGMAAGACLVVSDAGGIPEMIGCSGEAGVVFRRGDVESLKTQLVELMNSPERRQQLRERARARALGHFSLGRMVEEHASAYLRLLGESRMGSEPSLIPENSFESQSLREPT